MGGKVRDSPEPASVTCRGGFEIPLPVDRAARLFTPEGERAWVEGWDPRYPDAQADREAVGTVFVTQRDGDELTWVITAAGSSSKSYARWDPRGIVSVVEVELSEVEGELTRVEVTYRVTALTDEPRPELAAFEAGYAEYLAEWREAIAARIVDAQSPIR